MYSLSNQTQPTDHHPSEPNKGPKQTVGETHVFLKKMPKITTIIKGLWVGVRKHKELERMQSTSIVEGETANRTSSRLQKGGSSGHGTNNNELWSDSDDDDYNESESTKQ